MLARPRSTNPASSALRPLRKEGMYSEGKRRWRDEDDDSSSDGSNGGSDESSDEGEEEERPRRRRRRRRAQSVQQVSATSPLAILLAVACIAAIALALFFALRKSGGGSDSSAGTSGAAPVTVTVTPPGGGSGGGGGGSTDSPQGGSGGANGSSGRLGPTNSGGSGTNNPKPSSSNSASSPSPSSSGGGGSTDPFASACLAAHNDFRATHHADPLAWNATLAAAAEKWTKNCVWEHSGGKVGPYGENLFMVSPVDQNAQLDPKPGIASWNDEEKMYDYNNPGFTHDTGHFTQMIWKATTQLGCYYGKCNGIMQSGQLGGFFVCEYYPAGNVVGDNNKYFRENVLPP